MRKGVRQRITKQARRFDANPIDINRISAERLFVYQRNDGKWSVCRRMALVRFGTHWRWNRLDPSPFETQPEAFAYAMRLMREQS